MARDDDAEVRRVSGPASGFSSKKTYRKVRDGEHIGRNPDGQDVIKSDATGAAKSLGMGSNDDLSSVVNSPKKHLAGAAGGEAGKKLSAAASAVKNPKGAASAALSNTKLGKAANLTKPTAEGAKETTKEVAKGAAKGAATGGWIGAAKGAAISFAKTKAGRRVIAIAGSIVLVFALATPTAMFGMLFIMTGSMGGGDEERSSQSVLASDQTVEDLTAASNTADANGLPWAIVLAMEEEVGKDEVDIPLLRSVLDDVTTLGVGAVYDDKAGMVPGKKDREKDQAKLEREQYVAALEEYGLEEPAAGVVYDQALTWYLGQLDNCEAGPAPEPVEGDPAEDAEVPDEGSFVTITSSDGKKRAFTSAQINNLIAMISEAKKIPGMSDDALVVALMTVLVESGGKNYANSSVPGSEDHPHDAVGQDHDSLGLFQQRTFWVPEELRGASNTSKAVAWLMDIKNQTRAFFGGPDGPLGGSPMGLFDKTGWEDKPKGEAAQSVQGSAFPDKYAKQETMAVALLAKYGGASISTCDTGLNFSGEGGHPVGDANWPVSSGYGPRDSSGVASRIHGGIDFAGSDAFCNMPIYSIADGTVVQTGTNGGWGNTVRIDHGGFESLYAHQPHGSEKYWPQVGEKVTAGQRIGRIGNTGNSMGCHLHLEVFASGVRVDPAPFLTKELGVPLVWLDGANGKMPDAKVVPWYVPDLSKKLN